MHCTNFAKEPHYHLRPDELNELKVYKSEANGTMTHVMVRLHCRNSGRSPAWVRSFLAPHAGRRRKGERPAGTLACGEGIRRAKPMLQLGNAPAWVGTVRLPWGRVDGTAGTRSAGQVRSAREVRPGIAETS